MNCVWCLISQRLLWPLAVVERKVFRQPNQQFTHAGVAIEADVLMLDAAPQPFDPFAVDPVATAPQLYHHLRAGIKRVVGVLLVDERFDYLVCLIG